MKLIPFTVTIPPHQQDKQLPDKLRGELPGILNWALLGCAEWRQQGLGEPAAVANATADYREEMDVLATFLEECCVITPNATVGASDLYAKFVEWCASCGERTVNQREFGIRLSERGFERTRSTGGRMIRKGLGVASERSER